MHDIILKLLKHLDTAEYTEYRDRFVVLQKEVILYNMSFEDEIIHQSWAELFADDFLSYAILTKEENDFCGYCAVKIKADKPEVQIELLKKFRGKGIGFQALSQMMTDVGNRNQISCFIAAVEPDNYISQHLMYKLGGIPAGIRQTNFLDKDDIDSFEKDHIDLLDSHLYQIAKDFGVEPQKLLSHVLIFDIPLVSLREKTSKHNLYEPRAKTSLIDEQDRTISTAVRQYSINNTAEHVLSILKEYGDDDFEKGRRKAIEYLEKKLEH